MKKFLLIISCCVGLTFFSQPAEAANFSFSIGGFAPPVVVMDTGYYSPYYYSIPYYRNSYFYFGNGHRHRYAPPPPRHFHGHRPHLIGGAHRPHGGHGKGGHR